MLAPNQPCPLVADLLEPGDHRLLERIGKGVGVRGDHALATAARVDDPVERIERGCNRVANDAPVVAASSLPNLGLGDLRNIGGQSMAALWRAGYWHGTRLSPYWRHVKQPTTQGFGQPASPTRGTNTTAPSDHSVQ